MDREIVAQLDLAGALEAAGKRPGDFFPSRLGFAAAARSDTLISRLSASLRADYDASPAESAQVPKWSGGTRPALDLAVQDRVVLDAVIARLRSLIVPGLVNWSPRGNDRREAEQRLTALQSAYVLMTDVAAFYEYVDHAILADELLDMTGDDVLVSALTTVLGDLMQSSRGLPQGPISVGDLADVYLSVVDRRMVRDGFDIYRFTDDYRLPINSWESGRAAQVRLEHYLRDVGLVINVGKTITPRYELYVRWEGESRAAWLDEMVNQATRAPAENEGPATDDEEPSLVASEYESAEYEVPAGVDRRRVLARVEADFQSELEHAAFWGTPDNVRQSKRIRPALAVLASAGSTKMVGALPELLRSYPHLTMELSLALRQLISAEETAVAVLDGLNEVLSSEQVLFDWQVAWLLHAMVPAPAYLPTPLLAFAEARFHQEAAPWFVRARAAAVLATEGKLPLGSELQHLIDECPSATLPDLIGAAHWIPDGAGESFVKSVKDPISRAVPAALDELGVQWL